MVLRGCCHAMRPCGLPPERLSSIATLLVDLVLLVLQVLVRLDCGDGERVVVPPADERGHGGDASGHQLLHGGALDGQHGLAAGRQDLLVRASSRTAVRVMVPAEMVGAL